MIRIRANRRFNKERIKQCPNIKDLIIYDLNQNIDQKIIEGNVFSIKQIDGLADESHNLPPDEFLIEIEGFILPPDKFKEMVEVFRAIKQYESDIPEQLNNHISHLSSLLFYK